MGKALEAEVLKWEMEDQKKATNQPPEARHVQTRVGPEKSWWRSLWKAVFSKPGGEQDWE